MEKGNIYLLLIFFLALGTNYLYSQPIQLKIGNQWVYKDYLGFYTKETIIDTVIIQDSLKYYVIDRRTYFSMKYYVRYKEKDSLFVKRMENSGLENDEYIYYKKNIHLGDKFYQRTQVGDTIATFQVLDTLETYVYNNKTILKRIYREFNGGISGSLATWSDDFGLFYEAGEGSFGIDEWLTGCVIDNVVYGDTNTVVGINEESPLPKEFNLFQNYPNPFNPVTNISYQLPKAGFVTIKVFDILGKEIKTLVNESKEAGYYKVNFDGQRLATGIYIYTITVNDYYKAQKMLLIK